MLAGYVKEAETIYKEVLEASIKFYGEAHPHQSVFEYMSNLADCLRLQGNVWKCVLGPSRIEIGLISKNN